MMRPKSTMTSRALALLLAAACLAPAGLRAADCADDPAVSALEKAFKADSKNATTSYNLAVAYYNKQCYEGAIDAFERTAKLAKGDSPEHEDMRFQCYSALGGLYYQAKQDPKQAVADFKLALAIHPSDKDSLNGISMALMKMGDNEQAAEYLKKTILADPHNVEARYRMAVLLNQQLEAQKTPDPKLRQEVTEAFAKTADLAGKENKDLLVVCYTRLGELYRDEDKAEQSVEVLSKAVKLAPEDFNSRFILGQMQYKLKNYAAMIEQYQKAVEIDPKQKLARFNLGVAYINQEQYFEAYEQFKAITTLDSGDSEALALMGQTLERAVDQQLSLGAAKYTAEEYLEAKQAFEKVLSADPKNKTANEFLGKVNKALEESFATYMAQAKAALKKKKQEDAAEALERALSLKPDDPDAMEMRKKTKANISKLVGRYLSTGNSAFKHGDYETAEKSWRQAMNFREGKAKAEAALAKLQKLTAGQLKSSLSKAKTAMKKKDFVAARNAYRAALAAQKDNAEARNGLTQVNTLITDKVKKLVDSGRAHFEEGDKKAAKSSFEAALKLDPNNADANSYITRITGSESKTKVDADKVKTLYYQGVDLYVNNKIKEAIAVWQQLLKLDPNHQDALKNIERAKVKLKALQNLN
jgi:tetratricopeptide (TPR) repeat protein